MTIELLDSPSVVDTSQACLRKTIAAPATDVLGRIAHLETRLARSAAEIDAAQAIRYRVFVEEMKAQVAPEAERSKRDVDSWDTVCAQRAHLVGRAEHDEAVESGPADKQRRLNAQRIEQFDGRPQMIPLRQPSS